MAQRLPSRSISIETMQAHPHIEGAIQAFTSAFQARDFTHAAGVLADDVTFRSPVLEDHWRTKPVLERLGPAMVAVLDEVQFQEPLTADARAVLPFTARVDGVELEGMQLLEFDPDGLVAQMAILIRPLAALKVVAAAMQRAMDPDLQRF